MDTIYQTMLTSHPNLFSFVDELRPAKIVHISVPAAHLKAIVVVDNFRLRKMMKYRRWH